MAVTKESTLFQRVASGGEETIKGCLDLLSGYGYSPPQSRQELAYMLAQCCVDKGDHVLKEIAVYHPDKDFIIENIAAEQVALPVSTKHNDCGCAACAGKKHNDTGSESVGLTMPAPGTSAVTKTLDINQATVVLGLGIFSFSALVLLFVFAYKTFNK